MQDIQHFSIQVDDTVETPLFKQISEQVRQGIASSQIQSGQRLPTVRQLAKSIGINPSTVSKAYLELERDGVVISRRGGGTVVATKVDNPLAIKLRQNRLSNIVSGQVLHNLSLGYSPEELEAEFSLHLSRWQEERRERESNIEVKQQKILDRSNAIIFVGSHDPAFHLLANKTKNKYPEIDIEINHAGSLGGLIALQEGRAHLSGIHLLDEETGEYNYPYLKHLLPGRELAVVHMAYRIQGLMFAKENPKDIKGLEDLERDDVIFVNRQKGSGTRVLLDFELRKCGIDSSKIKGYNNEVDTHHAVAISISHGKADVSVGIQAAADTNGLGFVPLSRERYDLIIPIENYRSKLVALLLETVNSPEFKAIVNNMGGYDTSQTGSTTFSP
jgi:molybdate-binding protein/DNA-binding transcriptional regulator YhcF (GntR family)